MTQTTPVETKALVVYGKKLNMPVGTVKDFQNLLVSQADKMRDLLPQWSDAKLERIFSTAIEAAGGNAKILACSGASVLLSVKAECEFGLSFSKQLGQAYLVPRKGQCTLTIGYRGLMDLVRRAADVRAMDADAVFEGDVFEIQKGSEPKLTYIPKFQTAHERAHMTHVFAVAYFGAPQLPVFRVMTKAEVDGIRQRSPAANDGPWVTDYVAMAIKTVIRQLVKYLPLSAEKARILERAIEHDDATDGIVTATVSPADRQAALMAKLKTEDEPVDVQAEPVANKPPPDEPPATPGQQPLPY